MRPASLAGISLHHGHVIVTAGMLHCLLVVAMAGLFLTVSGSVRMIHRQMIHVVMTTIIVVPPLRLRTRTLAIPGYHGWIELVGLVPTLGIALQRRDHLRKGVSRSEEHTSELKSLMRIPYAI